MYEFVQDEKSNTLHPGQYGSRPGKDPKTVTLLEELRLDYSLLVRQPFINIDNDATSCYDRILLPISSLVARAHGIHRNVVFVHATTLEHAKFKLKYGAKVSEASYSHCTNFPIHGSGQGSSNSPTIWCFISSMLFKCHDSQAHGMIFRSPSGNNTLRMSIVGFVDDSTVITSDEPGKPVSSLIDRAQQDAQTWNDILFTSGGKLELPKCGFHVIYYEYTEAGIPYMLHSTNRPINLKANDNTQIPIQEKDIHTSRKNLGHFKSPSRNYAPQLHNLCTKATELSKAITSCPVSRDEAKQLYETVFRPAIEYPLGQSFLTPKQLHSIVMTRTFEWKQNRATSITDGKLLGVIVRFDC